ncbi:MAG: hypothetical protein KDC46_03180 [Thermoleophilia bacterium]|nr:hypothetical protein [Thermoleophilia bacterium]
MSLVTSIVERVLGTGRVATAAHDLPVAAGRAAEHLAPAAELEVLDAATRTPGRWYHSTASANLRSIEQSGLHVRLGSDGFYSDGIYFSSIPDAHYGRLMLSASVQTTNPFVVREGASFMDLAGFQDAIRPILERYVAAHPQEAATLSRGALQRAALLDAGHDSVLVQRRPWDAQWLVALRDDEVKLLTTTA